MKEKKYLVLGIMIVLLTFVGVSLAYFLTTIEGDRKNITINTADLRVIFTNGDAIEGTEIEPGWSVTKTFSVENKTKNEYKYNIVIENLVNTFKTIGYLQYKITSTDGGYNMTDFEDVPKSSSATDAVLSYSVSIPSKSTQNYTITIQYKNDENVDQSIDSLNNAVVTGKLYITEGTTNSKLLTQAMLEDNPTIEERTDFNVANTATTTGTIYQTNKTEDGSTVYYYSGNTINNWVKFGKESIQECTYNGDQVHYGIYDENTSISYKNIRGVASIDECVSFNICLDSEYGPIVGLADEEECEKAGGNWTTDKAIVGEKLEKDIYWRIIRTNEDEGVRLLYSGTNPDTTSGYIGISQFNENNNGPMYVGYMYGTSGTLENNRNNTSDSTIKTHIDIWYRNNLLTNYEKYISKSAIYCNDRSTRNNSYSTSNSFYYGGYTRLATYKNPSYKCGANTSNGLFESTQAVEDKFSASTEGGGNGQLTYPVALMTVDEVSFAGGKYSTSSPNTWYYANSNGDSITGSTMWWSLSPSGFYNSNIDVFRVEDGFLGYDVYYTLSVIRPVISLKSCVEYSSGNGTPESPYEVTIDDTCASAEN